VISASNQIVKDPCQPALTPFKAQELPTGLETCRFDSTTFRTVAQGIFTTLSNRLKFRFLKEPPGRLLPPRAKRSKHFASRSTSTACYLPCESLKLPYHLIQPFATARSSWFQTRLAICKSITPDFPLQPQASRRRSSLSALVRFRRGVSPQLTALPARRQPRSEPSNRLASADSLATTF